jgi:hypothetical protein
MNRFDNMTSNMLYLNTLAQKQAAVWTSQLGASSALVKPCALSQEPKPHVTFTDGRTFIAFKKMQDNLDCFHTYNFVVHDNNYGG